MRSNIVTEAGLPTRLNQWWAGVPFITSGVIIICGVIYLVCLLSGYDSFYSVCFLPSAIVSRFEVYRIYTAVLFHGSILHVVFNMMALVPLGTELERIMGSVRLLYLMLLLATTNAIFHLFIASMVAYNPLYAYPVVMNECAVGFSGVLFSMIVIETNLSGVHARSVFGLFNVPAKLYAWILLIIFQLLASNVSLLGHLCGILSGFAYTSGAFNYLLPGSSFYSAIESSSALSACIRRPGFILCTGGATYGNLPTHSNSNAQNSGLISGNLWRNLSTWMPQREMTEGAAQDPRFPGRGRTLGSARDQSAAAPESNLNLQTRLLDNSSEDHLSVASAQSTGSHIPDARRLASDNGRVGELAVHNQDTDRFDVVLKELVAMGFEKTQAEVALTAADGDPNVAIEILMTQQR